MKNLMMTVLLTVAINSFVIAAEDVSVKSDQTAAPVVNISKLKQQCAACHGSDGNSGAPAYPKLAGQNVKYLIKQMQDIQSGKRAVPAMTGQLDGVSEVEIRALAEFYAQQAVKSLNQANKDLLPLGEKIYRLGSKEKGLPACTGCHSPTGKGNPGAAFPALAGQHADYIAASLKAFREGAEYENKGRRNDEMQGVMRTIALRMSDKEIEAVANYISSLY